MPKMLTVTECAGCGFAYALETSEPIDWRCPDCSGRMIDLTSAHGAIDSLADKYGINPGTPGYRVALDATNALLAIAMAKPLIRMGRPLEALRALEAVV